MKKRLVIWLYSAVKDLNDIGAYIAAYNPVAANQVVDVIERIANNLGKLATGHKGRVEDTYEIGVSKYPYSIVYSIDRSAARNEVIHIIRIIHTARDWPDNQWPD